MRRFHRLAIALLVVNFPLLAISGPASASNWVEAITSGGSAQSQAEALPVPPSSLAVTCVSALGSKVTVTWSAVTHATSYTLYSSTTSATSGFSAVASGVAGTSWTSAALPTGNYWFEVAATVGATWSGGRSAATVETTVVKNASCRQT